MVSVVMKTKRKTRCFQIPQAAFSESYGLLRTVEIKLRFQISPAYLWMPPKCHRFFNLSHKHPQVLENVMCLSLGIFAT